MAIDDVLRPGHPVACAIARIGVDAAELVESVPWGLSDAEALQAVVDLDAAQRRLGRGPPRPGRRRARPRRRDCAGRRGHRGRAAGPVGAAPRHCPRKLDPATRAAGRDHLIAHAATLDPAELARVGRHLLHTLAPEDLVADEEQALSHRELHLIDLGDGTIRVRGTLDPLGAETLSTALNALTQPPSAEELDAASATPARRRADALVEMAHRLLGRPDVPTDHGERPRVIVTIDWDTLRRRYEDLNTPGGQHHAPAREDDPTDATAPAEDTTGTPGGTHAALARPGLHRDRPRPGLRRPAPPRAARHHR